MRKQLLAVAALILAVASVAPAQAVAGTWMTEFPLRLRVMNGVESSDGMGHARVSLALKGDSVTGTWQVTDGDTPPPARKLRGTVKEGKVRLESEPSERVINNGDGEQRIKMKTIYEFAVKGDALDGNQMVEALDGSFQSAWRKFTATREKK